MDPSFRWERELSGSIYSIVILNLVQDPAAPSVPLGPSFRWDDER